jgi:acyl-CoA thioesterase I
MRICFIGDSLVNGTGDPTLLGWVGRICAAARRRGVDLTCYNLGIRGNTSADIAQRWQEETTRRLPAGIDGGLVFSFGTNDCMIEGGAPRVAIERSLEHARAILDAARQKHPTLMLGPAPSMIGDADARIGPLSRALATLCAELGIAYLDLHTPLAAMPLWRIEITVGDGAHPGAAGYALIVDLVEGWEPWWRWTSPPEGAA